MRGIVEVLAVVVGVYLVMSGVLLTFQDRLAFPRLAYPLPTPEAAGLARADSVSVTTSDGVTLHGWYLHPTPAPPDGQVAPGLLWFYGNMEVDAGRISVYGRSLGSVPALFLAERYPLRSVVLDSPFTSARDMAAKHYWYLPRVFLRLQLDNLSRARHLRSPLLVFHGSADDIVPVWMARAVAEAGGGRLVVIDGAGHNDIYDVAGAGYREEMLEFLNREP
jgi:fermentation-respiration switch protein FrsA (DUF1100 family)